MTTLRFTGGTVVGADGCWPGAELTIDGSFRRKNTQAAFFQPFNTLFVVPNTPIAYNVTQLTTASVTVATEPVSGLSMMMVRYLNHQLETANSRVCIMYGVGVGQQTSGTRIISA